MCYTDLEFDKGLRVSPSSVSADKGMMGRICVDIISVIPNHEHMKKLNVKHLLISWELIHRFLN